MARVTVGPDPNLRRLSRLERVVAIRAIGERGRQVLETNPGAAEQKLFLAELFSEIEKILSVSQRSSSRRLSRPVIARIYRKAILDDNPILNLEDLHSRILQETTYTIQYQDSIDALRRALVEIYHLIKIHFETAGKECPIILRTNGQLIFKNIPYDRSVKTTAVDCTTVKLSEAELLMGRDWLVKTGFLSEEAVRLLSNTQVDEAMNRAFEHNIWLLTSMIESTYLRYTILTTTDYLKAQGIRRSIAAAVLDVFDSRPMHVNVKKVLPGPEEIPFITEVILLDSAIASELFNEFARILLDNPDPQNIKNKMLEKLREAIGHDDGKPIGVVFQWQKDGFPYSFNKMNGEYGKERIFEAVINWILAMDNQRRQIEN